MACCERCYEHYIEQDNSVNTEFLEKNFGVEYTIITQEIEDKSFVQMAKKLKQPIPMDTFVVVNGTKYSLCMCSCHVKGSHVFH